MMRKPPRISQLPLVLVPVLMLPVLIGALWLVLQPGRMAPGVLVIAGAVATAWYLLGGLTAAARLLEELRLRRDLRAGVRAMAAEPRPVWAVDSGGEVLAQNDAAAAHLDLVGHPVAGLLSRFRAGPEPLARAALARAGQATQIPLQPSGRVEVSRRPGSRIQLWTLDLPAGAEPDDPAPAIAAGQSVPADLPVALLWLDAGGAIVDANLQAHRLLGEELAGRPLAKILEGPGRPVREWLADMAENRESGRSEVLRVIASGAERFLQVTLSPCELNGKPGLVAVLTDASAMKTLEEKFVQSQKMQAIGQLAGGIAHDFNNLLTAITGHCDLLMLRRDKADPDYADLYQIGQNANRAAALVGQLLAFSRKQALNPQVIDLRDTLSDLTHLLNRLVGERARLTFTHDPALKSIRADRRQLEQVMMNLVVNARDAMPGGGEIAIQTENVRLAEGMPRDRVTLPRGNYVRVTVADQGCGIPADKIGKIFEPFFTTKRQGEGTGLGLSTAYGIVKQTGGFIFCDSIVGQGTTFELLFPVHRSGAPENAAPAPLEVPAVPAEGASPSGTILLVEDEAPVRAFAVRALRLRGLDVLEADNAEAALAILADDRVRADVFVTDVVMPGLDGPAWVRAALRDRPGTRVVFMSGYTEHSLADGALAIPNSVFLPKPFSLSDLVACVENQLAGRPPSSPAVSAADLVSA
ncbi:ATP-binding protein [Paracoccus sp. Z118]|uniref:ATP-binding protein n=1 Tax=Paracoccus sp. Z118 TaxID=2851017 RepID=UPI0035302C2C